MRVPALLAALQNHADPERAIPMRAYMKNHFDFLGIPKTQLMRVCRPFFKGAANAPTDWDFVQQCWESPYRDLAGAGMMVYASGQGQAQPLLMGLCVLFAMTVSCTIAGVAGALIPLILKRLGADPATASSIFLTTASDVASMGIFLSVSTLLLL